MASDPPDSSQLSSRLDALWVRDAGTGGALAQVAVPEAVPEPPPAPAAPPASATAPGVASDRGAPFLAATTAPDARGSAPPPPPPWGSGADPGGPFLSRSGVATITAAPPRTPPPAPPAERRRGRRRRWVVEWALVVLVAVGVAVGIRTFVVQTFFIPSASMQPTLMIGDRILVDKLSYHMHAVHRGDIVVFGKPPGENAGPEVKDLVKRIIGLPGDRISSSGGRVVIDGHPLAEPWLVAGTVTTGITPQTIPAGEFFVMGDNRSDSQDSRYFGPISRSLIVGRVVVRIWPLSALHFF